MKQPQTKMYIDARHEILDLDKIQTELYCIEKLDSDETRKNIYEAIGMYVLELSLVPNEPNQLLVKYRSDYLSDTFIDYRLRSLGIEFKRDGG